ncbi:hypothetical protein K3495_g1859 [Podosphaera aphanis]|nr:hypothetical protein K3495_g1859 [Podosphaera aphanis]
MEAQNAPSSFSHEERPLPPLPESPERQSSSLSVHHAKPPRDLTTSATSTYISGVNHAREPRHRKSSSIPRIAAPTSSFRDGIFNLSSTEFMAESVSRGFPKDDKSASTNRRTYCGNEQNQDSGSLSTNENILPDLLSTTQLSPSQALGGPLRGMTDSHSSMNSSDASRPPPTSMLPGSLNQLDTIERRELVTPRWQLDAEVTYCPICKSQFNFFVRKHHCRKCGRVVCNSCSPHRITIPYQYIILPPDIGNAVSSVSTSHYRTHNQAKITDYSGGERVRLCNPCVPDPNITSAQTVAELDEHQRRNSYISHSRSASTSTPVPHAPGTSQSFIETIGPIAANDPRRPRHYNYLTHRARNSRASNPSFTTSYSQQERGLRSETPGNRSRSSTIGTYSNEYVCGGHHNFHGDDPAQNPRTIMQSSHSRRSIHQSSRAPRRQIAEDDECWVCHEELPSKSLENFEALRAAHVNSCINAAIASTSGSSRDATGTISGNITGSSNEISPQQVSQNRYLFPPQRKHIGIFSYRATEKDKIDNAECTICLEDFEAGQDMGRLECFCRFHLKCIRGWFEMRPGQCPVHQHDRRY